MSDDRESKLRDSLELDRWEMAKRCAATLEREDWGSESFEVAAFALWYAMSGGQRESLTQILFSGPVWDGDHISKSARDDLFKLGLATRVCHKGEQGFTAASYRAFTVFKASGQEKQRKLDKLRDDRKEREYDALKEFVADKTSASAIAALEAPAQPLDELRSVPGAEEEVRHQFDDGEAMRMAHSIMPGSGATFKTDEEIRASVRSLVPESFTPHDGGDWKGNPRDAVQVVFESGAVSDVSHTVEDEARFWHWPWDGKSDRIVSFKIIAPAPIPEEDDDWTPTIQPAELTVADLDKLATKASPEERAEYDDPTAVAIAAYIKAENEAPAPEQDASVEIEPTTDLWQQGYNDKLNGFEPSLSEPEYTKGYEARELIEREHSETMERAKFFEGGMMADADRHQSDQRSIVEKIGGVLGFKQKENA